MKLRLLTCIAVLSFGTAEFAAGSTGAQKLAGTWAAQGDKGATDTTTWVFEEKGDSLKVTRMQGTRKLAEFECNTVGKDCEFNDAGKKARVSMWFLGPKLVELEVKGAEVIKRRFSVPD